MKSFVMSASGLSNIIFIGQNPRLDTYGDTNVNEKINQTSSIVDDSFQFILGENKIQMNRIFADFISPRVSCMHKVDPTINSITFNLFSTAILDTKLIDNFKRLCIGIPIEIDEEMSDKLRILSLFLDNEEIFTKMNELYPIKASESKIDVYLQYLQIYGLENINFNTLNNQVIIDHLSSQFYSIDKSKILNLPTSVIYEILSNKNLKITNEDYLLDFINEIDFNNCFSLNRVDFYELIEFQFLSERKFASFVDTFDSNEMTRNLWNKLSQCFYYNYSHKLNESDRYLNPIPSSENDTEVSYDNNEANKFKGIIFHLGKGDPKSVVGNGIIDITSSSVFSNGSDYQRENAVDFGDSNGCFSSAYEHNSWICYDFKERKVKITSYSIRSNNWGGKGNSHPQNWCIEGSCDNVSWIVLDERKNEQSIDGQCLSNNFKIKEQKDYFRYIRLRETGVNSGNTNRLILSALEYFGFIQEINK